MAGARHGFTKTQFPVDIFTGDRKEILQTLAGLVGTNITKHGWVDFTKEFTRLRGLAFLGGVGTLWECINQNIPMLIGPSITGDQLFNGNVVSKLGMGELVTQEDDTPVKVLGKIESILSENK